MVEIFVFLHEVVTRFRRRFSCSAKLLLTMNFQRQLDEIAKSFEQSPDTPAGIKQVTNSGLWAAWFNHDLILRKILYPPPLCFEYNNVNIVHIFQDSLSVDSTQFFQTFFKTFFQLGVPTLAYPFQGQLRVHANFVSAIIRLLYISFFLCLSLFF